MTPRYWAVVDAATGAVETIVHVFHWEGRTYRIRWTKQQALGRQCLTATGKAAVRKLLDSIECARRLL